MPRDVNPEFELEGPAFEAADARREAVPDRLVVNDAPNVRETLSDQEWGQVRTHLVDFVEAIRELPLDDSEPGLEPGEVTDDFEAAPAYAASSDVTDIQSKTVGRLLEGLEGELARGHPRRSNICRLVSDLVELLEVLGFPLLEEEALLVPLEGVRDTAGWWTFASQVAEPESVDPAREGRGSPLSGDRAQDG
jgi:hypothetical protein